MNMAEEKTLVPLSEQANEFSAFLFRTLGNTREKTILKRAFQSEQATRKATMLIARNCQSLDTKFLDAAVVTASLFHESFTAKSDLTFAQQFGKLCFSEESLEKRWDELIDSRDKTFMHRLCRLVKLMKSKFPNANFSYRQLFVDLALMQTSARNRVLDKWCEHAINR